MIRFAYLLALATLLIFLAGTGAISTEYYSSKTGQTCQACHKDPSGGGPLTSAGKAFAEGGYAWPLKATAAMPSGNSAGAGAARLVLGFLHILSGIVWIGTIFYVHLVLKPRYAVGGLPKTELRMAWISIAIIGVTGAPLTVMRYHDLSTLFATRSGFYLAVKIGLYLFLVLSAAYVTLVLNARLKKHRSGWQENDGREGRPAWVKVGDHLYDFSSSKRWGDGSHFGRHQAGQDLTEALKGAPHGPEKLAQFPSFSLAGKTLTKESAAVSTLFVMAYVNLFAALGVVVAIALWKWGW